jgi:hypothetical protein
MVCTDNHLSILPEFAASSTESVQAAKGAQLPKIEFDPLQPVRQWLDGVEIRDVKTAQFISKAIPAQCPFERDITLFGRKVGHIPPLCKLNPLYEELVGLRFRALCYLVDECGMDIESYC